MAREREHELIGWPLATLVVADRYLQVRDDIEPALAAGRTVIVDRYVASTLVLQRLDGLDPGVLWEINAQARRPDLMVVLQADPDTLRDRLRHRARYSRFEQMPDGAEQEMQFYTEAITLLERHGYCTLRIDTTSMPADGVARLIMERLESHRHSPRVATDE
jgi:dTMP kinase